MKARHILSILVVCGQSVVLLLGAGQRSPVRQLSTPSVRELMEQLRNGELMAVTVNRLADAHAVEAIPLLKEKFSRIDVKQAPANTYPSDEILDKATLASAIVRLGDPGKVYWEFISTLAQIAADSNAPFSMEIDAGGRSVPGKISSEFVAWAKSKNVPADKAFRDQAYGMQLRMIPLVITGDPRGQPILKKALESRNYYVQYRAAQGLALLRANDAVPAIIELCTKAPSEFAGVIARTLVYFDNQSAKQAAEKFIKNKELLDTYRQQNATDGPRGMFR